MYTKKQTKEQTNDSSQPVELFKDANEQSLLTELTNKIKHGDEKSLQKLYNGNHNLVVSVAKQYLDKGKTLEELVEAGNKGLLLAAQKYNPQHSFKFISYAVGFIRTSITSLLNSPKLDTNLSDISDITKDEMRELIPKMSNVRDKMILTRWFGIDTPQESAEEIGQSMQLTVRRVLQIRNRAIEKLLALKENNYSHNEDNCTQRS